MAESQQIVACGAALGLRIMVQPGKAVNVWRGLTDGACVGGALRRGLEARCHSVTDFRCKNVINSDTDEQKNMTVPKTETRCRRVRERTIVTQCHDVTVRHKMTGCQEVTVPKIDTNKCH